MQKGQPLLPPSFAETGFCVIRNGSPPPTRYQVIGERSSGTNFVKRLIGRNSDLVHADDLGWKHGFCQAIAVPADLAVICVVRDPERWVLSMFRKPWHSTAGMQQLPFSEFIRAEWQTVFDRPRYLGRLGHAYVGQPLQQDRDPLTGRPFATLFDLRNAKLRHLITFAARGCTCAVIRLEEAQADPRAAFARIRDGLSLPSRDGFRPVKKPQGWRFRSAVAERPPAPETLSDSDRAFMWDRLDHAQEAALGYRPPE